MRKGRKGKKGRRSAKSRNGNGGQWMTPGIPRQMVVVLRYPFSDTVTLNAGNSYQYDWVFRGNSAYDPDQTGAGSQPTGYDQWCGFYGYYRVDRSKLVVHANTTEVATTQAQVLLTVFPHISVNPGADYETLMGACRGANSRVVNLYTKNESTIAISTNRILYPELLPTNNNFCAASNANPAFEWYWHVTLDSSTVASDVDVLVTGYIDYKVMFFRPGVIAPS